MEKQLTCTICNQQYKENNVPRLLPKCGHSFCECCIKNRMKPAGDAIKVICPEDHEQMLFDDSDINNFPKNIALIKLLDTKKKDKSFHDCSLNESNIVKQCINEADEEDKQLITAINESTKGTEGHPYNRSGSGLDLDLDDVCLIHQKPLEIICIRDKTKICSTCAIFGDHKGHEFKSLEEVAKDKEKRCDQILNLIDRKESVEGKITGKETKAELAKTLKAKQEILCKQVKQRFAKISENIKNTQKKALDKIIKCFSILEQKLKQELKIPELTNKRYLRWQQRAFNVIQNFDGEDNLIEQLKLLNYDRAIDQIDLVQEGQKIISEIQQSLKSLEEYKSESLNSVSVEFNIEIQKKLGELVTVKELKKPGTTTVTQKQLPTAGKVGGVSIMVTPKKRSLTQTRPEFEMPLFEKISMPQFNQPHPQNDDNLLGDRIRQQEQPIVREIKQEPRLTLKEQISRPSLTLVSTPPAQPHLVTSPQETLRKMNSMNLRQSSFTFDKVMISKKKPKIKLPEKYEKVLDGIINDQLQTVDFTNAELGDATMIQIAQCMKGKKIKTLKLIRNKLTDQGLDRMLPYFSNILTLNLSQNLLTDRFIDRIIDNLPRLPNLRSLILSQNKIKQRNVKARLEEIKKYQIVVSL